MGFTPKQHMRFGMDNVMDNKTLPVKFAQQHFAYASRMPLPEGNRKAKLSLFCGVAGFFFMGIFLGFLAVLYAQRAEKMGVRATVGKVLGYIDILFGVVFSFLILEVLPHLI